MIQVQYPSNADLTSTEISRSESCPQFPGAPCAVKSLNFYFIWHSDKGTFHFWDAFGRTTNLDHLEYFVRADVLSILHFTYIHRF